MQADVKQPGWVSTVFIFALAALVTAMPLLVSTFLPAATTHSTRALDSDQPAQTMPSGNLGESVQTDDLAVTLLSMPAQPLVGLADVEAALVDATGQPVSDAKVTFDIDMTNMSHGLYQVDALAVGTGHYRGRVNFSMAGPWRIHVTSERPGQPATTVRFTFRVQSP